MVSGLAAIVAISDSNSEHPLRLRAGLALLEKLCHGEINVIISQPPLEVICESKAICIFFGCRRSNGRRVAGPG